jgi:UDP-N-acetylmuramoyl-L-alanyl-D-glutamate--2,6-diaminopimelate ligase
VRFEYGIFTNLTRDHLDFHKDIQSYFEAKASLFESCKKIVVNADDPYGRRLLDRYPTAIRCSQTAGELCARDIECSVEGTRYTLKYGQTEYKMDLNSRGKFSAINSMQAAAVALDAGIDEKAVIGGLSRFSGAPGRMQRVDMGECPFDVLIDFAHTPDALEKLLLSVRQINMGRGRIISLFGCGGDRDRGKRKEMALIASRLSDFVIVTSDNPRSEDPEAIIRDILKGIDKEKPYEVLPDRRQAIEFALGIAGQGDIVLLCGKGHEKYQITSEGKQPFDEEQIVISALGRIKNLR